MEAGRNMPNYLSLRGYVYDNVVRMIQKGKFKPGQKITEQAVCDELNISRTPAREALIQLAADGVLESAPRRGFVIKQADASLQQETYAVQAVLDSFAASIAVPNITDEDIAKLRQYVEHMDVAIKYRAYDTYYDLQERFHQTYIDRCGNDILIDLIHKVKSGVVGSTYYGSDTENLFTILEQMNGEHSRIVELIEARDAAGLEHYLRYTHWAVRYENT